MERRNERTRVVVSSILGVALAFQLCSAANAQVTYNAGAGVLLPTDVTDNGIPVYDITLIDGSVWSLEIDCQPAIVNFDAPFDGGWIYISAFGCTVVDCPGPTLNFGPNASASFIWAGPRSHVNLYGGSVDGFGLVQVDIGAQVTIYGDEFDVLDWQGQTTTYGPGTVLFNTGYIVVVSTYDVRDGGIAPLFSGPISITEGAFVLLDTETIDLELAVQIDVRPGGNPNTINMYSNGKVPVAVLSDEIFDATLVLPETVEFAGASVALCGKDRYMAHASDVDGDGYDDMVFHFRTKDLQLDSGVTEAALTLTGQLMIQDNLITISGADTVYILWPKEWNWDRRFMNGQFHPGKHRGKGALDWPHKDKKRTTKK